MSSADLARWLGTHFGFSHCESAATVVAVAVATAATAARTAAPAATRLCENIVGCRGSEDTMDALAAPVAAQTGVGKMG